MSCNSGELYDGELYGGELYGGELSGWWVVLVASCQGGKFISDEL
jgi:hypothetical protein